MSAKESKRGSRNNYWNQYFSCLFKGTTNGDNVDDAVDYYDSNDKYDGNNCGDIKGDNDDGYAACDGDDDGAGDVIW